jgi:hypothetical protein
MESDKEAVEPPTSKKILGTNIPDVSQSGQSEALRTWMSRVAVTTAVLATFASISSMFSSNHLNEAMVDQIRASDQWAFFQAKGVKATVLEGKMEILPALGKTASADDAARFDRYKKEQEDISRDAKAMQALCDDHRTRYKTLGRSATAFQIGIAIAAVALLMRKNWFWFLSMGVGAVGLVFFVIGVLPA